MVDRVGGRFYFLVVAATVIAVLSVLPGADLRSRPALTSPAIPPAAYPYNALSYPPPAARLLPAVITPPAARRGPEDPAELARFLDPIVREGMRSLKVPGATLAVVKDGRLFYTKGYGFANLEKQTPVLPDRTLFRVGSVSKLFTATAVMQLSEQGKVDLHADVNQYLTRFKIPNRFQKPVTLANLLTHTAGFNEQIIGMCSRSESDVPPLGTYLKERMPTQFARPGTVISYSNHGSALAGYIVQTVSGEKFNDYVEQNIFGPLQMRRSSFELPARLAPELATGYAYRDDAYHPLPYLYLNIPPAGSLNSTATDMAHFMIAHLQNGRYENARILNEKTAEEMHRQQFTAHPGLPGFAYGFYERIQNGERAIEHGGLLPGYSTILLLLPDRHVGIFISCNAARPLFNELVVQQFLNHYYPAKAAAPRPRPAAENLRRFAGSYRYNRYDRDSFLKLNMLGSDVRVSAPGDGTLAIHIPSAGETHWVPIGPLLFQLQGGQQRLAFGEDANGRINRAYLSIVTFDRLAWYETTGVQLRILMLSVILFFATLVRALFRIRRRAKPMPSLTQRLQRLAIFISAGNLLFIFGFYFAFVTSGWELLYGVPNLILALLIIPMITTIPTIFLARTMFDAWRRGRQDFLDRGHLTAFIVTALAFTWFLHYWNLLGVRC